MAAISNLSETTPEQKQARFDAYTAIHTGTDISNEWMRCEARFSYFLRYVRIPDVNKGLIEYELWPYLIEIADDWQTGDSWIEGKARQLGYSWLIACYDVWLGTFREYARILSFSIHQPESEELMDKVKSVNEHLPDWLRSEFNKNGLTKNHVEWVDTKAQMEAMPSSGRAGRGYTATLVQTDEWAFHENAAEHFSAYRPTIAAGGQHIAISTGNGAFNMFHRYFSSKSSTIPYKKRFNGWRSRPDRDDLWYARERDAFLVDSLDPESDDFGKHPGLFKRENPATVDEMFEVFVGLVYDCFDAVVHVKGAVFDWKQAKHRVYGVDPGQGDPFAIVVIGESAGGHAHQFGEFYRQGVVSEDMAADYLMQWHKIAPFDAGYVDTVEGTLIATLASRGLRAHPANKQRKTGIGHVYGRLFARNFTIDPTCRSTLKEYGEYQFAKVRKGQEEWATSTPVGHHGDAMDATRYALVGLAQGFQHTVDPEQVQPNWNRTEQPKAMVVPDKAHPGAVHDAGVSRKKPRQRGPDYRHRPSMGAPARRPSMGGMGSLGLRGNR